MNTRLYVRSNLLNRVSSFLRGVGLIPILLIILIAMMGLSEPRFYSTANLFNILRNASFLAIIACGQMLVIIVGGMDLSVGAVAALVSVIAAKVMAGIAEESGAYSAVAILLGIFTSLAAAVAVGLFNGLCTTLLRVPSLIVTLGTLSIVAGVTLMITSGIPVYGMPPDFIAGFGRAVWWGCPAPAYVAVFLVAGVWLVQRKTVFGTRIYAIGGNPWAAAVSGISATGNAVLTFVFCSALAGVTGLLITAQIGSGQTNLGGDRLMLLSIAAAVIGGTSLRGGIGRADMVAVSAIFLSALTNALNLLRVDSKKELVLLGLVVVAAVALDSFGRGKAVAE
jgi:ribose transport system permease protein